MYNIINTRNFSAFLHISGEKFTQPSLTEPGQVLPLDELVRRYVRGQTVETFSAEYTGDDETFIEFDRLDKVDRMEASRQLAESIRAFQQKGQSDAPPPPQQKSDVSTEPKGSNNDEV